MCDPFFMLILIENLGSEYIVWDKAATIRFKRPGRGRVHADFSISEEVIHQIKQDLNPGGKIEKTFTVQVKDREDQVIAEVEKLLYIKRKELKDSNT